MRIFVIYLALVLGCWGVLLEPHIQFDKASNYLQIDMHIENIRSALFAACIYSLPAVLALWLPSKMALLRGKDVVYINCNWVLVVPYIMHCLYGFGASVLSIFHQADIAEMYMAENMSRMVTKLILVYSVQVFAMIEIVMTLFYGIKIMALDGARLF